METMNYQAKEVGLAYPDGFWCCTKGCVFIGTMACLGPEDPAAAAGILISGAIVFSQGG
jgi:hypothetical protein